MKQYMRKHQTLEPIDDRITERTKAIVAVDYAGQMADYDGLNQIAKERGIAEADLVVRRGIRTLRILRAGRCDRRQRQRGQGENV